MKLINACCWGFVAASLYYVANAFLPGVVGPLTTVIVFSTVAKIVHD